MTEELFALLMVAAAVVIALAWRPLWWLVVEAARWVAVLFLMAAIFINTCGWCLWFWLTGRTGAALARYETASKRMKAWLTK